MSNASDITASRIIRLNEEGFKPDCYDDANDARIECVGEPTVGFGTRCRQWSRQFAAAVMSLELSMEFEAPLLQLPWYLGCNDVRRSALLEVVYNQGVMGLVKGYPTLIEAVRAEDWPTAQANCTVKNENVKPRYARIGRILLSGVDE